VERYRVKGMGTSIGYAASRASKVLRKKTHPAPASKFVKRFVYRCGRCGNPFMKNDNRLRFVRYEMVCTLCVPNHEHRHHPERFAS